MVDGIYNQKYRIPNFSVETVDTPLPIPVYFMRSVGSTAAVFFWESFISELAGHVKADQYAYRRHLLTAEPLALRPWTPWHRRRIGRPRRHRVCIAASRIIATSAVVAALKPMSRKWSN